MLGVILSMISLMMVSSVWGEMVLWSMIISGLMVMSSSDSLNWKSGLSGELDYVGWGLNLLSVWIVLLAMLGSKNVKKLSQSWGVYIMVMVSLVSMLMVSFYVSEFIFFFISYESCLIPIFFLILGWGYQPERALAGVYMLFYMLLGSLPLFFFVLKMESLGSSYMHNVWSAPFVNFFFYLFMVSSFLVKFPMFSVHLWLLKAHVEAPVAGSMILAGILLKLGGYGLIRFLVFWANSPILMSELFVCVSLWGGVVVSLSCLRQSDMKLLIASSSVVHMSMCLSGLFILSELSQKGAVLVMLGHGLCSSGLFYLAHMVYERTKSRSLSVSKGLLSLMPSMCMWWFMLSSSNMAAPPSLNLLGEIWLMSSLVSWSVSLSIAIGLISFFSAGYSLYLFSLSQHGVYLSSKGGFHSGSLMDYLICSSHWLPLNIMIFFLFWLV
uniref:NADH-ubiquinone oxidoreductase chain 4 n=1 Tax=Gammarus pisinnus TaxID=1486748 RepID=A0A517LS61_9CRUS|nr:NADH dehydrogenase subunit 4 [Gammarus pisinnus]QDS78471.1 NADH dehydrogenase subunit 4 [Gammarus pisinnus]